jgi:uracil-DNA glycosylase
MDDANRRALREVLRSLTAHAERQRECGAAWLPRVAASAPAPPRAVGRGDDTAGGAATIAAPARRFSAPLPAPTAAARAPAQPPAAETLFADPALPGVETMQALRAHIGDCTRCKLARCGRTQIVFGVGNPTADLMFVGEGPGRDEDLQGEPFVGRAGQLLTEIITKGMKLRREDVYIANVVKCRPPENRNPEPDEIAACMPFLTRQIELVAPKVIVALGKFAAHTLLDVKTPIMRLRGTWQNYRGVKVMPTLHPAYLLRTPGDKRLVWEDIKLVMAELGLPT